MRATSIITLLLISQCLFAQKIETVDDSIKYIQDYYSDFSTGYDFDGKDITLSDNYKATFSDSIFTLTFDKADENEILQKQTIIIKLNDVVSIEPSGAEMVEIFGDETYAIPICGKLAFITATETYEINIYYEVDEDVERTQIYKAFTELIDSLK